MRPREVRRRGNAMARRCETDGKAVLVGNNVSHANNKTKRRLPAEPLRRDADQRHPGAVGSSAHLGQRLRSVEHRGGLDAFLMKSSEDDLSPRAGFCASRSPEGSEATAAA